MTTSTSVQATITNEDVIKLIDINSDYDPSYNPDGSKIAFTVRDPNGMVRDSIWDFNLTTGEKNQIYMPSSGDLLHTKWSPVGDKIVYVYFPQPGIGDVCTIDIDGSNQFCLTPDQDFDVLGPSYSPDGSKIVYGSHIHDPYDIGDLWIMDANGGNKVQLTDDREYQSGPSVSPDGTKIAYSSGLWPNAHIWVMDVANPNNKEQLTFGSGFEAEPSWSPDGRKIAFVSHGVNNNINWNIYEMTLGGIDNTPPVIVCGTADGLWHRSDVNISCTASDSESGLANPADAIFSLSTNVAAGEETDSASTGSHNVCDNAGNCATAGPITGNKVDKKTTGIIIVMPGAGTYTFNQVVAASYSCTDGGSGVATCDGPVPSGSNFDTSTVGLKSFTVNAQDNVGNTASATNNYNVIYNFNGFFQPVDNIPTLNTAKAGSSIPMKFNLSGNQGLNIFSSGYPASQKRDCDSNAPIDEINETVTAGKSNLSYDATIDQYNYVWKTDKAWTGTCRQIILRLIDGTDYMANFKFR